LQQVKFVFTAHRTRHVDEEHKVGAIVCSAGFVRRGETEHEQLSVGVPWTLRDLCLHVEEVSVGRFRVVVGEVVEHLLDAHGPARYFVESVTVGDHAADICI